MKNLCLPLICLVTLLTISSSAFSVQRFTVIGEVIDAQTCKPIADAKIVMLQVENGMTAEVTSKENGKFVHHFTIIGTVKFKVEKEGYSPVESQIYARLGDNNVGYIALLKTNKPLLTVCEKIINSPFGQELKKMITEIPELPEEKDLSEKYQSALAAISIQDYEAAKPILLEEEKLHPDNFVINFYLGLCYFRTDKFDEAIKRWTKAQELSPSRIIILKNLGLAYEKKGDREKAAEYIQKYAEEVSKSDTAKLQDKRSVFYDAGLYWYNAGNAEKYYAAFSKVLEFDNTDGNAWFYVGMYYFGVQKNKECVEAMEKAIASPSISEDNKQTAIAIRDAAKSVM